MIKKLYPNLTIVNKMLKTLNKMFVIRYGGFPA